MADRKITAGTSLTGAGVDVVNDVLVIVDVSDTTDGATGTTKKMTVAESFKVPQYLLRTAVSDANLTVTTAHGLVAYTALTAARTVSLPAAATVSGKVVVVKDEIGLAGTFNIIVDANASETIDGVGNLTKTINTNYGSLTLYCNGAAWFTI